ncbi:unnamed protein product [Urochloa humidicola]
MFLAYEKAESSRRYICSLNQIDIKDLVALMKIMFPKYNFADKHCWFSTTDVKLEYNSAGGYNSFCF